MKRKILLVEDYDDVREMMSTLLRLHGYEVLEAANGSEAVEITIEQMPDMILMDLGMPEMDGIEATRAIRRNGHVSEIPIIAVTAYSNSYRERALEAGCNSVLQKPLEFEHLEPLLKTYIPES